MNGFGPHLMLDGYGCDREKLEDLNAIYKILDELPARIGMTRIMPPYVFRYSGLKPEDWGISGFVLIAESHISVHTFPDRGYVWVDIFSCKGFDATQAIDNIKERFLLNKWQVHVLPRGLEYPDTVTVAASQAIAERHWVADSLQPTGRTAAHPLLPS